MTENKRYELVKLDRRQTADTYERWMKIQFPDNELKPLKAIEEMVDRGIYEALGLMDGNELVAYAYLGMVTEKGGILLDYYAVLPHHQNKGLGGIFLDMLRQHYAGWEAIIIESENPDFIRGDSERATALRRLDFYRRSGCVRTRLLEKLWGVEFRIFVLPVEQTYTAEAVHKALSEIYHGFLPDDVYEKQVIFRFSED